MISGNHTWNKERSKTKEKKKKKGVFYVDIILNVLNNFLLAFLTPTPFSFNFFFGMCKFWGSIKKINVLFVHNYNTANFHSNCILYRRWHRWYLMIVVTCEFSYVLFLIVESFWNCNLQIHILVCFVDIYRKREIYVLFVYCCSM